MEEVRIGKSGSLESNDLMITVDLNYEKGISIEIESVVKEKFGKQIEKVIKKTLEELEIENIFVNIVDKGALDCTIRARLKTAVRRAKGGK